MWTDNGSKLLNIPLRTPPVIDGLRHLFRAVDLHRRGLSNEVIMTRKRYTNQTFTKRVDHAGGRHRPFASVHEPAVCRKCGAIYSDRRWTAKRNITVSHKHSHFRPPVPALCPACQRIERNIVRGYVKLSGDFLAKHREEIDHLINNETARAWEDNPLSKIISIDDSHDALLITTTTEHLAERLGHALEKAYDGEVSYHFAHEDKLVRVTWHRD